MYIYTQRLKNTYVLVNNDIYVHIYIYIYALDMFLCMLYIHMKREGRREHYLPRACEYCLYVYIHEGI